MNRTPIIIDCDPGQDDAIMLMMALASRDVLDILGITTAAGNVPLAKTARNARLICELTGQTDIPVYAGCAGPLEGSLKSAEEVHGAEGMNGADIYEPAMPLQDGHAVDFIIKTLRGAARPITIVVTGPMTNIAQVLEQAPDCAVNIKDLVVMAGARSEGGNVTPSAEFNVFADPHAADIVYRAGLPITTIGLDVTHGVISNPARLAAIKAINNKVAETAWSILGPNSFYDQDIYFTDGAPLHDPCTIAYVLRPELFQTKHCNISVETTSELTMGHTSIDFWHRTDRPPNTHWAHGANVDAIYDLLLECLSKY